MLTEKTVDRESQQKLYVQMFSIIKERIEKEWPVTADLTEDELCRTTRQRNGSHGDRRSGAERLSQETAGQARSDAFFAGLASP
jgi:hypothetical protein